METISDSTGIRGSVESKIGGRSENQDSYGMAETRIGMLVVVCDGMGGGPAGKTASSLATQAIIDYVSGASDDKSPVSVLEDAAVSANESVLAEVAKNPALKGMGTTCVCVLIRKGQAFIMHVGDSRCYQLRGNNAVFRTADHSYVGELVRRGSMTEEDARNSKYSNVITKAIGAGPDIEPEVDTVSVRPGDRFALMSDGIWGMMPEPELVGLLAYNADVTQLVPQIAARVDDSGRQQGGGHDNLTLALVELPGRKPTVNDVFSTVNAPANHKPQAPAKTTSKEVDYELKETESPEKKKKKSKGGLIVWMLGLALVAAIGVIVWLLAFKGKNDEGEKVVVTEVTDSINSPRQDSLNKITDNKEFKEKAEDNIKEYAEKTVPQTENKVVSGAVYSEVIKSLGDLKSYKYKGYKESDKELVENKRREMYRSIKDRFGKLVSAEQDAKLQDKLSIVAKALDSKEKMVVIVDKKQGFTTKDGEDAIDDLVKRINALAK